jgi:hypothetical protein
MGNPLERGRSSVVVAVATVAIVGCSLTALDGFDEGDSNRPGVEGQTQGSSGSTGSPTGTSGGSSGDALPGGGTSGGDGTSGGIPDPSRDAGPDGPPPAPRTGDGSCLTPYRLGLGIHTIPGCSAMYPRKCGAQMPVLQIAGELSTAKVTVEGPNLWRLSSPACTGTSTSCSSAAGVSQTVTPTSEIVVGRRNEACENLRVLVEPD